MSRLPERRLDAARAAHEEAGSAEARQGRMVVTPSPTRRSRRWLAAVVAVSALVAGACAGEDEQGGTGGGERPEAGAPRNEATGEPIVVGMLNQEDAPTGSFPELREGAEAAVAYMNADLGGVDNHPLELRVCKTRGTPESSQACADQLLAHDPVAIIGGGDYGAATALPLFEEAGVPFVSSSPTTSAELTSDISYLFAGGVVNDLLGMAEYAGGELEIDRVAVVFIDLPGLIRDAAPIVEAVLRGQGMSSVTLVPERADAADFAPALIAATDDDPEAIAVLFPAQGCSRIMQAAQSVAVTADLFYTSACMDTDVIEAAGGGAEGGYFASSFLPYTDDSDEEVATYLEQLAARGPSGADPSLLSQTAFSVAMNLRSVLAEAEADDDGIPTPEQLRAALDATEDHPSFMGHPFTCDRRQVKVATALCSASIRLFQYQDGDFVDVADDWFDGAHLIP
jgi:branched-chain amino acid transport system substrate-binding protein